MYSIIRTIILYPNGKQFYNLEYNAYVQFL